jgi:hypothetical protein
MSRTAEARTFFVSRIGAISLHRIAACSFLLIMTVLQRPIAAQQMGTYGQTPNVVQLPASGRTMEPTGSVSSQQTTSTGTGSSILQPSVTVTGNFQGSIPGAPVLTGPLRLSLSDAVKRGVVTNLGIVTSGVSTSIVRA